MRAWSKILSLSAIAGMSLLAWQAPAAAAPSLLGVFDGNDSNIINNAWWGNELGVDPSPFLGKLDCDDDACSSTTPTDGELSGSDFSLTVNTLKDGTDAIDGTWSYSGPAFVRYLVVKGSDQFAIYNFTEGVVGSGTWSTSDLSFTNPGGQTIQPGLSHLSFYDTGDSNGTPIPAPAPLLLIGSALIGLGLVTRRRLRDLQ